MRTERICRIEDDGTRTPMVLVPSADAESWRYFAKLLIQWCTEAMDAMSRVAPDATRFGSLYEQWDALERTHGHVIREALHESQQEEEK